MKVIGRVLGGGASRVSEGIRGLARAQGTRVIGSQWPVARVEERRNEGFAVSLV